MKDFYVIPLLLHLHALPYSRHVHPARGGRRCVLGVSQHCIHFRAILKILSLLKSRLVNSISISRLTLAVPLLCSAGSNYLQVVLREYPLLCRGDSESFLIVSESQGQPE